MSQQHIFHQSGTIAGIPGDFANCIVDIADDGTQTIMPLALLPAFAPETPLEVLQDEVTILAKEVQDADKTKGVQ